MGDKQELFQSGKQSGHLAHCVLGGLGVLCSAFPGKGVSVISDVLLGLETLLGAQGRVPAAGRPGGWGLQARAMLPGL